MSPYRTERGIYTTRDLVLWQNNQVLEITPKFQRRAVWRTPARSLFIDTILREMTVPPIYLRWTQNEKKSKAIREVVDGQHRVRSVLEYISDNGYRLSKTLQAPWAGKTYAQLAPDEQEKIQSFGFTAETFNGISDQQVLEVFSRLNMNGIPLNKQELRNGKFFGYFKQCAFSLAVAYLEFWRNQKIFSEQSIARMLEVELTSELLIAGRDGMQDKKTTIDDYYQEFEESFPHQERDESRFREVIATISETFPGEDLSVSEFRRPPLFYTLHCVVYHHMFGLPRIEQSCPRKHLKPDQRESLREAVIHLSEILAQSKDPAGAVPKKYAKFVTACQRQTDNLNPRKDRFESLYREAF
jgi:hypothetical protein